MGNKLVHVSAKPAKPCSMLWRMPLYQSNFEATLAALAPASQDLVPPSPPPGSMALNSPALGT